MTDDGFVFGDDEAADDETALFGTADESNAGRASPNRFETDAIDDADSGSFGRRVRTLMSDATLKTAAMVVLGGFVVALGLGGYPLVMGALDTADGPIDGNTRADTDVTSPTSTSTATPTAEATAAEATATTVTMAETTTPSTTTTASPTTRTANPTPTERTTTAVPMRGFPAGEPVADNETTGTS